MMDMGLLEIELAKLDYTERMQAAEQQRQAHRRRDLIRDRAPRPAGPRRTAKIDAPVLTLRFGGFRYRLWFTRTVAL